MKFFKTVIYIFFLIVQLWQCKAQDPQFSQFYSAGLYLSPSFAGAGRGGRVAASYRNQWPDIPNQFNTYYMGVDYFFPNYRSSVGSYILRDYAGYGKYSTTSIQLQYAYTFKIFRWLYVKPGMQIGYLNRSIDYSKLIFGDQLAFEGNTPISNERKIYDRIDLFDYAASALFYSDMGWIGTTFDHLPFPNESLLGAESSSPMKFSLFGGIRIPIKKRLLLIRQEYLSFSFVYKRQNIFRQLDMGINWEHYPVLLGVSYRGLPFVKGQYKYFDQDAIVTKVGVIFEKFSLGYSYDFNISALRSFSGGAHELSMIMLFNQNQENKKKIRALPCPNF